MKAAFLARAGMNRASGLWLRCPLPLARWGTPAARDALLTAIARARCWLEDLVSGKAALLAEIAGREATKKGTSGLWHPVAFVSLALSAIATCDAPHNLTVSTLAQGLALLWIDQVH